MSFEKNIILAMVDEKTIEGKHKARVIYWKQKQDDICKFADDTKLADIMVWEKGYLWTRWMVWQINENSVYKVILVERINGRCVL